MSGTQPEDASPPRRNWTSSPELNETREPFLSPSADYDDEEFLRYLWKEYLHPKEYEWALIAGYIVVFIVALVGNVLGECGAPKLPPSPSFFLTRGWVSPLPAAGHAASPAAGLQGGKGLPDTGGSGTAEPGSRPHPPGTGAETARPALRGQRPRLSSRPEGCCSLLRPAVLGTPKRARCRAGRDNGGQGRGGKGRGGQGRPRPGHEGAQLSSPPCPISSSPPRPISPSSPHLPLTPFPRLPISLSPHHLPVSSSPPRPISPSPYLPLSPLSPLIAPFPHPPPRPLAPPERPPPRTPPWSSLCPGAPAICVPYLQH